MGRLIDGVFHKSGPMQTTSNGIEKLRLMYPWPVVEPNLQYNLESLLDDETGQALLDTMGFHGRRMKDRGSRCVIELGSYLGASATFMLANMTDDSAMVCIDHWNGFPGWDLHRRREPHYHQFVRNMLGYRDRCVPVREKTVAGLQRVHDCGVKPDLIWIDAGHSEKEVYEDIAVSCELFPGVDLIGHDWSNRPGVQLGVAKATNEGLTTDLPVFKHGVNWWSLTKG